MCRELVGQSFSWFPNAYPEFECLKKNSYLNMCCQKNLHKHTKISTNTTSIGQQESKSLWPQADVYPKYTIRKSKLQIHLAEPRRIVHRYQMSILLSLPLTVCMSPYDKLHLRSEFSRWTEPSFIERSPAFRTALAFTRHFWLYYRIYVLSMLI